MPARLAGDGHCRRGCGYRKSRGCLSGRDQDGEPDGLGQLRPGGDASAVGVGSPLVGSPLVGVGVLVGVGADVAGTGVGDGVGAATGQVNADVSVYTGCADDAGAGTTGEGASVAVEVAGALGGTSVRLGCVLATVGSALGRHLAAEECDFTAFDVRDALPVPLCPPGTAAVDGVTLPLHVPLPSVPAVVRCDPLPPPCNTVLAWMMAFRNGRSPSVTPATTATAAKTAASRNDQFPHPGKLRRRNRGHRASVSRESQPGQAQCPRQVQFRIPSAAPRRTLSSQGRGGRPAMRERILSSPSLPGSTSLAASDRARRSASSRPSSPGEVMPSPHPPATSVITTPAPRST